MTPILEITVGRRTREGARIVATLERIPGEAPLCFDAPYELDPAALLLAVDAREYGEILGRSVFVDTIADAFLMASGAADRQRVRLVIEEPQLQTLRWERLCAPRDGVFVPMGLDQRCLFSIFQPSRSTQRYRPLGPSDLTALVVVACPTNLSEYGLDRFDTTAALLSVTRSLDNSHIPYTVLGHDVGSSGLPTMDALCAAITQHSPSILHVICHGQSRAKDGETILYLSNDQQQVDAVTGTQWLDRLSLLVGPRGLPQCVFLCTCESASPQAAGTLGNLALRMARDLGSPAIVAMGDKVSVDTGLVLGRGFYSALRTHGEVDRAVAEACAPLADRPDVLVPVLYSRLGSRPLFSLAQDRPLTAAERTYGLARVLSLVLARAPADEGLWTQELQGRMVPWAHVEEQLLPTGERALFADAMADVDRFTREVSGTSFAALCLGGQPEPYDSRCPFLGLSAFSEAEAAFFFGRESLVEHITDAVVAHRMVVVVGPSGSGKSSLVLAGVVPTLRKRVPDLATLRLTPGSEPLVTLERALPTLPDNGVLVVDQFEELFTLCDEPEQRWRFVELLRQHSGKVSLILTLRADYVGDCTEFGWLKEILQKHWVLAAPMGALELRGAIERQAAVVGLRFEPGVCARIIEQINDQPGAMPLVQHTLLELYRRRRGKLLRLEAYEATGGVFEAITKTAERIFESAPVQEQGWLRAIFLRLVRLDSTDSALAVDRQRGTRARVGVDELRPPGVDMDTLRGILLRLTDARLIVTSRDSRDDGEGHLDADRVEVAHEALLRHWPRLGEWIREDKDALLRRQEVERLAADWQNYQNDPGLLVQPGRKLDDVVLLRNHPRITLTPLAESFLAASLALKNALEVARLQQARRKRIVIGVAITILAGVWVAMALLWSRAEENRVREAVARREAQTNEQRAEAAQRLAEDAKTQAVEASDRAVSEARGAAFAASLASVATVADKDPLTASLLLGETTRIDPEREPRAGWANAFDLLQKPVPLRTMRTQSPTVAMVFTNDSQRALSLHDSGRLLLSDVASGNVIEQLGSRGADSSLALSPNGKWAAVARCEDTVQLWEVDSGKMGPELRGEGRACQAMFSEDGALVVTYGGSAEVGVWDAVTGTRLARVIDNVSMSKVRIHAGKGVLVTVGSEIRMWDLRLQQIRYAEPLDRDLVPDVQLAMDGRFLLIVWPRRSLRIVWTETGALHPSFESMGPVSIRKVEVSADGRFVLMVSDSEVSLWKTDETYGMIAIDSPVRRTRNDTEVALVKDARFSANGKWMLAQLEGGVGVIAKGDTAEVIWRFDGVRGAARFSPDERFLVAQTEWVRIWDLDVGKKVAEFRAGAHHGALAVVSPDGRKVMTVLGDGSIGIWPVVTGMDVLTLTPRKVPTTLWFSDDGQRVFAANETVELWKSQDGTPLGNLMLLNGELRGVVADPRAPWLLMFGHEAAMYQTDGTPQGKVVGWDNTWGAPMVSPDGKSFVAVGPKGVRVWSQDGAVVRDWNGEKHEGTIRGAWLLADGESILVASRAPTGVLEVKVVSSNGEARELTPESAIRSVVVDPKGVWALWVLEGGGAEAMMTTGDSVVELGLETIVVAAAFAPDGQLLLTGSDNGVLRVWEVGTWNVRVTIRQTGDRIEKVGFSHDGRWCWSLARDSGDGEGEKQNKELLLSVYRTTDGLLVAAFSVAEEDNVAPAFSKDGQWMALVKNGNVVVIPTTWKRLVDKVRGRTQSCLSAHQRVLWLGEDPKVAEQRAEECEEM